MLLTFHNTGPTKQDVNSVRLAGKVIGMSFFAFTTRLDLEVPARQELATEVQLNLSELDGTATGLIPAEISLIRVDGSVIDSRTFISDVRGSLRSAYGLFGLAVAGLTAVFLIGLIRDIAARRLPHNRWQRGIRFLAPGVGAGLTATFTLSATRVLAPQAGVWVPLILVFGALAFLLGYFTPTPDDETQSWQESLERQGEQQPPRRSPSTLPPKARSTPGTTSGNRGGSRLDHSHGQQCSCGQAAEPTQEQQRARQQMAAESPADHGGSEAGHGTDQSHPD